MSKLGLVVILMLLGLAQKMLVLEAMTHESEAPVPQRYEKSDRIAEHPVSEAAEAPQNQRMGKHHSTDKSVAGGGVIIGGLVTAIFAAVFCYIRVTRKRDTIY